MKNKINKEISDAMSGNPANWIGPAYFNKKDMRIFVPKLYPSFGYTLNFGNVYTYLILTAFILVVFAASYL